MQLSGARAADVTVLRVEESKLTYPVLEAFFAEVRSVVDLGARRLVLDLGAVVFIDSPAIGCLMDVHRLLKDAGGALKLSGLHPRIDTMLTLTGVRRVMGIHPHTADAVAAFDGGAAVDEAVPPDRGVHSRGGTASTSSASARLRAAAPSSLPL